MKIERYSTINYTPAVILATKGWLEANQKGIGESNASIHWEQSGIVAFSEVLPVGVITWTNQPALGAFYIEQAYVEPEWRRRGVFRAMFADLVEQARERSVRLIRLGTHPRNEACSLYERMGGSVSAIFFQFEVQP